MEVWKGGKNMEEHHKDSGAGKCKYVDLIRMEESHRVVAWLELQYRCR